MLRLSLIAFIALLAPSVGCSQAKKDTMSAPTIEYAAAPNDAWNAALKQAADAFVAGWKSKRPLLRVQAAPVDASLPYWVALGFSQAADGPLNGSRVFMLDGAMVKTWTPSKRVAALTQIGLPAKRPSAALLARFLEETGLFGDDFPGFWDTYAQAPRDGRAARWAEGVLQIDYQTVDDDGGGPGGITAPTLRRLNVRFDGKTISVTKATR